jgi:hypothetical protein
MANYRPGLGSREHNRIVDLLGRKRPAALRVAKCGH